MQTLDLNDLCPETAKFQTSARPGESFTLNKVTLRTQVWLQKRFGKENIQGIFENQSIPDIAEIAYFLLQEKDKIKTLDEFLDLIVTHQDRINLLQAMLTTIGLSQPVIDKIAERTMGEMKAPETPTGASSTT